MSAYEINNVSDFIVVGSHSPDVVMVSAHDSRDEAPVWFTMPLHVALVMAAQIAAQVIEIQNENNEEKA